MVNYPLNSVQSQEGNFLPNFCANETVFIVVLMAELLALSLSLAQTPSTQDFWLVLAFHSLFIQWIALSAMAILCLLRQHLCRHSAFYNTSISFIIVQILTIFYGFIAQFLLNHQYIIPSYQVAISSIVTAIILRYLYIQHQWKLQTEAEARARFEALQARIRPHFLFNSLNTIASLVSSRPDDAEEVVLDLAELFRAALRDNYHSTLEDELTLLQRYLAIESLRLGPRLQVEWDIDTSLDQSLALPGLLLQPLVENAVYHGIQPAPEGGKLCIQLQQHYQQLRIEISNPYHAAAPRQEGQRMAQANVRQRLELAYAGRARFNIEQSAERYSVILWLPLENH